MSLIEVDENSYVDVEFADEYFSTSLTAEKWENTDEETKEKALIQATKRIDMQKFAGFTVSRYFEVIDSYNQPFLQSRLGDLEDQKLAFPRVFEYRGRDLYQKEVPTEVKEATCEEALALLKHLDNASKRDERIKQGLIRYRVGDAEEQYSEDLAKRMQGKVELLSDMAIQLLSKYLRGSVKMS